MMAWVVLLCDIIIGIVESLLSLFTRAYSTLSPRKSTSIFIASLRTITSFGTSNVSAVRNKRKVTLLSNEELRTGCRLGIDSHADMSCVGRHARVLERYEGKSCTVYPFNDEMKPMQNIHTVNAVYAFDSDDGRVFLLQINQALDFSSTMEHGLLCPTQARINGVVVDDVPLLLDQHKVSKHAIWIPNTDIHMPLSMHGPISYLPVRYPTDEDLRFGEYVELTSEDSWSPESLDVMGRDHSVISALQGVIDSPLDMEPGRNLPAELSDINKCIFRQASALKHKYTNEVTPEQLAKLWNIPIKSAVKTLKCTDPDCIKISQGSMYRRVKTRAHQRRYKQLSGYLGMFASDTFISKVKSIRGNTCIQLFTNRGNFAKCYPMKSKGHAHHALDRFIHEVGVPSEMLTDGAKELTMNDWGKICRRHKIQCNVTEPYSPWQNPAELAGGTIKRRIRSLMRRTNTPIRLWDYCWEYVTELKSLTATDHIQLDDVTPYERVHGYAPNIGEYLSFKWYQWIWYHNPVTNEKELGRWLGPAHNCGQGFAYYVLSPQGKVKTRSTVHHLTAVELESPTVKERIEDFTQSVEAIIGNYCKATFDSADGNLQSEEDPYNVLFGDLDGAQDDADIEYQELDDTSNVVTKPEAEESMMSEPAYRESHDKYIGAEVPLPHQGERKMGTVVGRKRDSVGNLIGVPSSNPITDSRVYNVEFPDGTLAEYSLNTIAENIYADTDQEGRLHSILNNIVDHKKDDTALGTKDGWYTNKSGFSKRRITTKGWKMLIEWQDGSTSWLPLRDVKDSNPIQVAEYAISAGIEDEPAFAWWVNHTLRKRDRIVKAIKHRMIKRNIKFGIQIPSSVKEALEFDAANGNNMWQAAIDKELKNVKIAFELLPDGETPPSGSKLIPYHIIFDVRPDLTRKARLVAGGHRHKDVPPHATYSSVVSRDSVRLMFMIAALNDLDILSTDIGNAYLNAINREKVHVIVGPELFGEQYSGQYAIIVRALYGLKSAGAAWHSHLSKYITEELGYKSTIADPDVYLKPCIKPNGEKYYSYLVIYVDDVLCFHHHPKKIMDMIGDTFRLKNGVEVPKMYLGTDIRNWEVQDENGVGKQCWAIGSNTYIKEAIRIAEAHMRSHNLSYSSSKRLGRSTPFNDSTYRPELDTTALCNENLITIYQNLIGVLRWTCELGRIDILHEVSLLSQYLAQPRMGHLQQSINIFYYLKYHDRSWMVMDPTSFDIDWVPRSDKDIHPEERASLLREIYTDAVDEVPHNCPEPRGNGIDLNVFVDADHAGNKVTRRSHTGIIIFCNLSPILWYSKRQNTVETSTFGSEFIALRIAVELIESMRYKLRMFGIPLNGPARVFCDNESVVKSSSNPEATLKKKHCSIAFHRVREAVAAGKILVYYEKTETNLADLLTKPLTAMKRRGLIDGILN